MPGRLPLAEPCDCLLVGGGPAGATTAYLLAKSGARVVLVDDGRPRHSGPFETLLPAAGRLLERLGLGAIVRGASEPDPMRHGAIWGSDEVRWQETASGVGMLLHRGPFDRSLRHAAAAAGALVHENSRVAGRLGDGRADGTVVVHGPLGAAHIYRPTVVVAATGRGTGSGARVGSGGPATIACTVVGVPSPGTASTAVVEAVETGWVWFQAPRPERATAAVLLDARAPNEGSLARRVQRALASCRGPARALAAAPVRHAVTATARCRAAHAGVLWIGDAAATIDPLASQGVEKALAAGDHAAAVVRTLGASPDLRPELLAEHLRWEHGLWSAHQERSRAFHRAETRFVGAAFWRARAGDPVRDEVVVDDDAIYVVAPGVRAVAALRRVGDTFERCAGAECNGDRLTHVGFVPIAPLLATLARPTSLHGAIAAAGRDARCFVLPPAAVRTALHALVRRGWLTPDRNGGGSR